MGHCLHSLSSGGSALLCTGAPDMLDPGTVSRGCQRTRVVKCTTTIGG